MHRSSRPRSQRGVPSAWRGLCLALVALLLLVAPSFAQDPLPYPRLGNIYLPTLVDSAVIRTLAKWDMVIVNSVWTDQQLAQLRQINPNIKIFFYVIVYTVNLPPAGGDSWKLENYQYAAANDLWWYDKNGGIGSDWPETRMCNITQFGPSGPRGPWKRYIAERIAELVSAHPDLDGVMCDNFWEQLSWQQQFRQLDSDCNPTHNPAGCDGIADSNARLDSLWNDALGEIAADVRARFDVLQLGRPRPLALITNGGSDYYESINGSMIEYFPSGHSNVDFANPYGYNWYEEMMAAPSGYLVAPFRPTPYKVQMLNADYYGTVWTPARNPEFERNKRFTLVSSLLGDGYYSLDAAAAGHGNLWWEPEYDHAGRGKGYLGQPLGPMVRLLQPTGPEILHNGSFTDGTTGWFAYPFGGAAGNFTIDASTFHSAPGAARIDVTTAPGGGTMKLWQADVPLVRYQPYTLSFWARSTSMQTLVVHLYSDSCTNLRCWNDRRYFVAPQWQRFEISFYSNGTAGAGLDFFVGVPGSLWLDDVSLRPGDTGLFRRDFQHGVALLNYTNTAQTVDLGDTFWRLRIPDSPEWNGARITQEIIPPSDARIVMRDSVPPLPDTTGVSDAPMPGARNVLRQNEPNPFNPSTEIAFTLERSETAELAVYDVAGRRLRVLVDGPRVAGVLHRARWDGRDSRGRALPSGVYFYRLKTPSFTQSRKMILLR